MTITYQVNEMLQEMQWNTLEERRKKDRLVMFYKIQNDRTGIDTGKYLKPLGRVSRHARITKLMRSHSLSLIIINCYYRKIVIPLVFAEWRFAPLPSHFSWPNLPLLLKLKKTPTAAGETEHLLSRKHTPILQAIMRWSRLSSHKGFLRLRGFLLVLCRLSK